MTSTPLIDPPTRTVWAIDVLASTVSMACITEPEDHSAAPRPKIGKVDLALQGRSHTPYTQWHRASIAADAVFAKLTVDGTIKPTLVVIAKQQWGTSSGGKKGGAAPDPTAQRRIALQSLIEERLHRAAIPVAEFPYPTALVWMQGHGQHRGPLMTVLADRVSDTFGITAPREVVGGKERAVSFRPQVAALAAIAAMAVGIETSIPVTKDRLEITRGQGNQAVQFPSTRRCPETVEDWQALHKHPNRLKGDQ